jgi:hypothetical protein
VRRYVKGRTRNRDDEPDEQWDEGAGEEAESLRIKRRIAQLDEQLIAMDAELADLRSSAIARLQRKIDEARAQGWDLFAEMIQQVRREIARAQGRLASFGAGFIPPPRSERK